MNGPLIIIPPLKFERYRQQISQQLGAKDRERLDVLLKITDPATGVANLGESYEAMFPDLGPELAAAALRKFRLNFNDAAKESGLPDVRLSGDTKKKSPNEQRACWIEGPDTVVAEIEELSRAGAANTEDHEPLPSRVIATDDRLLVRFFVSFSHKNEQDKEKLLPLLREELSASGKYRFELWSDGQIILGEKWHEEIQAALKTCDLGLLLVSPTFLASEYIADHELPAFVSGEKPCIPVELKTIDLKNHKTRGLEERQIFRFKQAKGHKAFSQLRAKQDREAFARELAGQIYRRLEAHPPTHRSVRSSPASKPSKPQLYEIAESSAIDADCPGAFIPTRARAWGIHQKEAVDAKSASSAEDHDAIQFLRDWALKPGEAPFFALLGEYGMGKTTTLKQFTRRLLDERDKDPNLPLPIYIDLRHRMNPRNGVPRLEEILDNALQRNWRKTEPLTVTAQQLIGLARQGKAIVLFDGLDEQIVHYSEADAQTFIRELWSITPPVLIGRPNPPSTKVLISCRSHYFKDLRQQDNMLTGEQREGLKPSHYRVAFILPFTEEQIRSYLDQELGTEAGGRAWELLSEIHDLKDLASRPYLLSLITGHIEEIERLKAAGQPIRPVTLYQILTRKWLDRDAGKHHLDPDHKPGIMAALAADMHREGAREWPWTRLVTWFDGFFHQHPEFQTAYKNTDRALLLEDLRTATFILRPDTEEQNFRFAHSSLLEFFLSTYLHNALLEGILDRWDLPLPSRETFRFIGEWIETSGSRDTSLASLANLLEQDERPQGTLNAFHYFLLAAGAKLPVPMPGRFALAGHDFSDLLIAGREGSPLGLTRADFSGANLRRTRWVNVTLVDACFVDAELQQSDFSDCRLSDANFSGADLTSTNFSDCLTYGMKTAGARQDSTFFHRGAGHNLPALGSREVRPRTAKLAVTWPFIPNAVAFSPDGRTIVSGGHDSTLRLWDAATAKCLLTIEGHQNGINTAAFSPDGRTIVSGGGDGTLRLWDATTAKCLLNFEGHTHWIAAAAFSPDGRTIVSGGHDGSLRLWDAATAKCLLNFEEHPNGINAAAFSPDGRTIVSGGHDGTLRLWDAATAKCLFNFEGHKHGINATAFSPDGRTFISGGLDGTLRLWDAATAKCLFTFEGHKHWNGAAAFSPDGRTIVSGGGGGMLYLRDAATAKCLLTFEGHKHWTAGAAFSPDGRAIVSAGHDGTLRLWDSATAKCLLTFEGQKQAINAAAFSPDGRTIVSGGHDGTLRLWDAATAKRLLTFEGHILWNAVAAFSPDGRTIVSGGGDGVLRLSDAATAKCLLTFTGQDNWINAAAFSPDGRTIISGGSDGTLQLWDSATAKCLFNFEGHKHGVNTAAFSPDGRTIVSGGYDDPIRLWDAATAKCLRSYEGHKHGVNTAAFSPGGRTIVSGGYDGTLRLWDAETAKCLRTYEGHKSGIATAAFSPDGRTIVSGGYDGTLRLWDTVTAKCRVTFEGHKNGIAAAAFSPDGRTIVSGSYDGTLRLWDANSGKEAFSILGQRSEESSCMVFRENRLVWAEKNAWRHISWMLPPPEGEVYSTLVPGDYFQDFPIGLDS